MGIELEGVLARTTTMPSGCMEWSRARSKYGYGQLWDGAKVVYVHRVVAGLVYGAPTPGSEVLHSCDNPPCVNPQHLSWGTRAENMRDASQKGRLVGKRHLTGEAHPATPLKTADVLSIRARRAGGEIYRTIAADYGVSIAAVHNIVRRVTWKEVI